MAQKSISPAFRKEGFWITRQLVRGRAQAHFHNDLQLNFILRGAARYFLAGQFYDVKAGRLTVFWAGMPHQLIPLEEKAEAFWAIIPLTWFSQWPLPSSFCERLWRGELLLESNPQTSTHDRTLMEGWFHDFQRGSSELRKIVLVEIETRLRRLALQHESARGSARSRVASVRTGDLIERVTRHIAQQYAEPITATTIAAAVGVHPNYLMRRFKKVCGISLWDYVLRLRVSHAQQLLLTTDQKILDIALNSGFASLSRFYHAFQRFCACTPRQYRTEKGLQIEQILRESRR